MLLLKWLKKKSKLENVQQNQKFKTLNPESQFFYVEDGKLHLLKTHTMKKGLEDRGIKVVGVWQSWIRNIKVRYHL